MVSSVNKAVVGRTFGLLLLLVAAMVVSADSWAGGDLDDPRLHPGEVRILKLDNSDLKEIIPDTLFMKHWFGTDVSVAYFRFMEGKGTDKGSMPAMHQHGEEWAIQLKGTSQVIEEDGTVHEIAQGDVFIISPRILHTGTFGDEENVILGVITPPREDYPAEGVKSYYPGVAEEKE